MNDDFANNAIMFLPLATACLVLPFVAFKKPQRYFALGAISLSIVAFFCYARSLTLWLSYGDCATLPTRFFHQLIRGDKDSFVKDTRFKVRIQGTTLLPNGRLGGFTTVRASDCVEVTIESEDEGSPMQAKAEMEKRIRGAARVVERGLKVDIPVHPDGERAVMQLGSDARAEIVVHFKGNSRLHIIESASMAHALAYEKLIEKGYRFDPQGYVIATGQ